MLLPSSIYIQFRFKRSYFSPSGLLSLSDGLIPTALFKNGCREEAPKEAWMPLLNQRIPLRCTSIIEQRSLPREPKVDISIHSSRRAKKTIDGSCRIMHYSTENQKNVLVKKHKKTNIYLTKASFTQGLSSPKASFAQSLASPKASSPYLKFYKSHQG